MYEPPDHKPHDPAAGEGKFSWSSGHHGAESEISIQSLEIDTIGEKP